MFDTAAEISANGFINNLKQIACSYDLYGSYFNVTNADIKKNNGIYFVCGYDKDTIESECTNNHIDELYYTQQYSQDIIRLDLFVMRVTDNIPELVYTSVVKFCAYASLMKGMMVMAECPVVLSLVPKLFVKEVEYLYKLSVSDAYTEEQRAQYREGLIKYINTTGVEYSKNDGVDILNTDISFEVPKDKFRTSQIPIEQLIYNSSDIKKLWVEEEYADDLQAKLKELSVFFAKTKIFKYNYGLPRQFKELLPFSQKYALFFIQETNYTLALCIYISLKGSIDTKAKEVYGTPEGVKYSGIPAEDIFKFLDIVKELHIPVSVSKDLLYYSTIKSENYKKDHSKIDNRLTVCFSHKYDDTFNIAFEKYIKSYNNYRILTPEDEKKFLKGVKHNV